MGKSKKNEIEETVVTDEVVIEEKNILSDEDAKQLEENEVINVEAEKVTIEKTEESSDETEKAEAKETKEAETEKVEEKEEITEETSEETKTIKKENKTTKKSTEKDAEKASTTVENKPVLKCIIPFTDKETGEKYKANDILKVSDERANELLADKRKLVKWSY